MFNVPPCLQRPTNSATNGPSLMKQLIHIPAWRQVGVCRRRPLFLLALILCSGGLRGENPTNRPVVPVFDEELSAYRKIEPTGAVAALQKRLTRGEASLILSW